jgi:hypothetical protein
LADGASAPSAEAARCESAPHLLAYRIPNGLLLKQEDKSMAVQWNKDADAALAEAKAAKRPLLVDFSAAPA